MTLETHIYIVGLLLIILALIHVGFPKYFKWKQELEQLSLINSQMMKWHTAFIALTVFLMGLLCVTSGAELIETRLGQKILIGLGIFWLLRLVVQFFGYSSLLWKGKRFETIIHIIFSILWIYISSIFWIAGLKL